MLDKYLSNRFFILYLIPFVVGLLTVFSFQPFNITLLNFFILPIFFYLTVYINKKSKSTFRKKPYRKNLFISGSLFGFGFYLKLVGNIGADKASYVNIFTPTIALLLSTLFENYEWSWVGLIGVLLIIIGNIIVLYAKPVN